jgi:23S rRNA (uracil1939-C5)-methyltransferase
VDAEQKGYFEGAIVSVQEASPHRIDPPCPYYGLCGGCAYQHSTYEHELEMKAHQVSEAFRRIAKLENLPFQPIIPSPREYGYRNRITVHSNGHATGFFSTGREQLVDVERCLIANEAVNEALAQFRKQKRIEPGHYTMRANPGERGFKQVNDEVAPALVKEANRLIEQFAAGDEVLVDAYCGAGMYGFGLLPHFRRVVGIEWSGPAMDRARARQEEGDLEARKKLDLREGDVAELLPEALRDVPLPQTTLLVNPPAEGLGKRVLRSIELNSPEHLLYASCNPATLARDIKRLAERYEILSITPVDLFPQTAEIEALVMLRKGR